MVEPRVPTSGAQHVLELGEQRVMVASVGASLRSYRVAGRDLVVPFGADELRPNYRGATVAPWPNRVVDGSYRFGEESYQLPLNEVDRGHALHGFTAWSNFAEVPGPAEVPGSAEVPGPAERAPHSSLRLAATIEPQAGYPWRLRIETSYVLEERGLTQTVVAHNLSDSPAPYGVCPHPYLIAGEGPIDTWTLLSPAHEVLEADGPRLMPGGLLPVEHDAARFDFREPRALGEARIDHAFTSLSRDEFGAARVELRAPDGRGVAMSWGSECSWMQIYTDDPARLGVAVEPMTCSPDAFNRGADAGLIELHPGERHTASWRIEPLGR